MTANSDGRSRTASKGTSLNRPFRFGSKAGHSDKLARHRTSLRADIFSHGIDEHITIFPNSVHISNACAFDKESESSKEGTVDFSPVQVFIHELRVFPFF
jgi:hypothetical protein